MPWRSIYFEKNETDKQLRKSGFWEQPAVCPRWQALSNYSYGWGPGFETLGSSKMLQRVQKNIVRLTDKAADPPYRVPPSMSDRSLNLTPGGKNFAKKDETIEPIQEVNLNGIKMLRELSDDIKADIERNFMNDLFLLIVNQPAASPITATEVMERKEEKLQMIGPAIESLLHENLDPIVKRVFR
jgi:predicted transcriptional regulator